MHKCDQKQFSAYRVSRAIIGGFAAFALLISVFSAPVPAGPRCAVSTDADLYEERLQQAILLMQYKDIVVRATDGKIRCNEDAKNARQVCRIDGPGEMLVDTGTDLIVISLVGTGSHVVHILEKGEAICTS